MRKVNLKPNRKMRRKLQKVFQNNLGLTARVRWEVRNERSDN